MKRVVLTPAEVAFALSIASQRQAAKMSCVEDVIYGDATSFGRHFVGALGEVVATKTYGGKISQEVFQKGDNHAHDITISDGRKVEVKTSQYTKKDVDMKFSSEAEMNGSEWFMLVQAISFPDVYNVSCIVSKDDVIRLGKQKDYSYGKRWVVSAEDMENGGA